MTSPLTLILIGVVSLIAFDIIIYWHRSTKGSWKEWPAGQSLMALLTIIAFGFGYGVINNILGQYPARPVVSFILYALFIGALVFIRVTIRKELRAGKRRLIAKTPPPNGPVTVTVATANEETPDVR